MRRSVAGFTFLELQTVVGVIGILAAIAIPSYLGYLRRAKAAEGEVLLRAIAHRIAVAEEEGRPVASCGPTPSEVPKDAPVPFEPDECWQQLGFSPDLVTWHQLELELHEGGARLLARSDLDGDDAVRTLTLEPGALRVAETTGDVW